MPGQSSASGRTTAAVVHTNALEDARGLALFLHPRSSMLVQREVGGGLLILGVVLGAQLARPQAATLACIGELRMLAGGGDARARMENENPILVDKWKEGLAKGVSPARLDNALRELAEAVRQAQQEMPPFVAKEASTELLRALVDAAHGGVPRADVVSVLRSGGRERAIEVLTALVQRGYPTTLAAQVVGSLSGRPSELGQLVDQAERLRNIDGATSTEALDVIARANSQGLGPDHAAQLLHQPAEPLDNASRGPNRETSGSRGPKNGGVAAPGRAITRGCAAAARWWRLAGCATPGEHDLRETDPYRASPRASQLDRPRVRGGDIVAPCPNILPSIRSQWPAAAGSRAYAVASTA